MGNFFAKKEKKSKPMVKELFIGNEAGEVKASRLRKYVESGEFLETLFSPQKFLEPLIALSIQVLGGTEPEKKGSFASGGNESRYTVLRILNKFSLKGVRNVELVHALHGVLRNDNLPNVILALKALSSISRSGVIGGDLVDVHVGVLLGTVHNLFGNMESGDEGLTEMSLFTFTEIVGHARMFFRGLEYCAIKIDQFLACVYGHVRRILENRRFMDLVVHKKVFSIGMCSGICSLLKLTYEQLPVIARSGPYHVFACEIGLVGMYYCPLELADLRKEMYTVFEKTCVGNRETLLPMIDKIYMAPFLFSPDALETTIRGIEMLSELLGHARESLSKASYMEFGLRVSDVLSSSCSSIRRLCMEAKRDGRSPFPGDGMDSAMRLHADAIRVGLQAVENGCRCFGSRTGDVEELSSFYFRGFHDLRSGFEGIEELATVVGPGGSDLPRLMQRFVSGAKEVVGRIGVLEKSGSTIVLSVSEIHILYEMFERSFDVFLHPDLCREQDIEEFFSVLALVREHIASDIIRYCSGRILKYSKRSAGFFGIWKLMTKSVVLGNALITHMLPQLIDELRNGDFEFVKKAMAYVVPFFGNDMKKIKRANTFFMHRLISMLMVSQLEDVQHFEILLEIFNIFGSMAEKSSFFQKYIFDNFSRMVEHFMRLYEAQAKEIFIRMIFSLPISISLLETDIHFLVKPIEKALGLGGSIRTRALSILVYVLDFSTPERTAGLEKEWKGILKRVVEGLRDGSVSLLCSKILGKLKRYHKVFIKDDEDFAEMYEDLDLIRLVVDGKNRIPAHLLFFDAVQKMRGRFSLAERDFSSEGFLVKFRRIGPRDDDKEAMSSAFRLVTRVVYSLIGWDLFRRDAVLKCCTALFEEIGRGKCVVNVSDHVYSGYGMECGRRGLASRDLAQYVYDGVLALFGCHGTELEKKAQQFLHSIFGSVVLHKVFSFYRSEEKRYSIVLGTDTLFDAVLEAFGDVGNPMPFRVLSVMFVQVYELLGSRSSEFCTELYGAIFSRLEAMCKSSNRRCRNAGINGIMCLAASMPVREVVLLRVPEDAFSCAYLYLLPQGSEDFSLALRLVVFILRFRYKGIRKYILSEGGEKYFMMSEFTPFVVGLFDSQRHVVEFSKTVLVEIFQSYAPQLLSRHKDIVFRFLKEEYVIDNAATLIRHLRVFIFCLREGRCPFSDSEMKYLLGKFLDNIASKEEWRGGDGVYMSFDHGSGGKDRKEESLCECGRKPGEVEDGDDLVVVLGGIYKRLSELSMRDLMELVLTNVMDVLCIGCKRGVYKRIDFQDVHFNNEMEELMHLVREFYLIVIEHGSSGAEISAGILYLLRHVSDDSTEYLRRAYVLRPCETGAVVSEEVEKCLAEKVDYKVLNMLLCAYSVEEIPRNPRVGMLVQKILKELRVPKEFAIIAQNDRYSMLAKAYEIGVLLVGQESLCNEILETYIVLDGYARSYTSKVYPSMVRYAETLGGQFISCMLRRIQDPSVYHLCSRLCSDSRKVREMVSGMKERLAERISQIYYRLEGNESIDMNVFVYSYKFLDLVGYEMKPGDIHVILGIYSDLKARSRNSSEIKGLIDRHIGKLSGENLEALFKVDPWFVSVRGIGVASLGEGLSLPSLKGVIRSIDRNDRPALGRVGASLGENSHLVVETLVEMGVFSEELIRYCKENLQNTNTRSLLLYYLCTFEPLYVYFEILFKMPYEDRKYTIYCLEKIVDAFEPILFEEIILIVLRSEVRFKTSLHILLPLLLSRPVLISKKVALELIGSICKLLHSGVHSHQCLGFQLYETLYSRHPPGEGHEEAEYGCAMRGTYTLMFVRFVHMGGDVCDRVPLEYDFELDFELVQYSPKDMNVGNVFKFLEMEMSSKKSREYKEMLLKSVWEILMPHFRTRMFGVKVAEHLIDNFLWSYKDVPRELESGVEYSCEVLYSLLVILCDRAVRMGGSSNDLSWDGVGEMMVCVSVIKHLFGEYNKSKDEVLLGHVESGLERIFHVLFLSCEMEDVVCKVGELFLESFRDSSADVRPLAAKMSFLMSDLRMSLATKIEMVCLLDHRKYDCEFLSELLLPVFGKYRRSEAVFPPGLQKFVMKGLCSRNKVLRSGYFDLIDSSIPGEKYLRLVHLLGMDWRHSTKTGYIIAAMMMMLFDEVEIDTDKYYGRTCKEGFLDPWGAQKTVTKGPVDKSNGLRLMMNFLEDIDLYTFRTMKPDLVDILYHFEESVLPVLTGVVRVVACSLDDQQCSKVFKSFVGFCKEVVGDGKLLGALVKGLEPVYRHVDLGELINVFRGGDGWFSVVEYANDKQKAEIYRKLVDEDRYFGMRRVVSCFPETMQAYFLQQIGRVREAQGLYEEIQGKAGEHKISFDEGEYNAWQEEWVRCAKDLQQWDVCNDVGLETGNCLLRVESAWHLSSFTTAESLRRFKSMGDAGEDEFEKRFYGMFADVFVKYSPERIRKMVVQNIVELAGYPSESGAGFRLFMYLQMMIEMVESEPLLCGRIDSVEALTSILFRWKDKEPCIYESFGQWSLFNTWRRHIYSRLGASERLGVGEYKSPGRGYSEEIPSPSSRRGGGTQMFSPREVGENGLRIKKEIQTRGANERAKLLNAFAKAAIDYGHYDTALYHLKEVFDLSSVKVGDAFQKVVYELLCLLGKKEYKVGLEQCGTINIQHFSDAQSSVLFNFKGLFSERLGRLPDAERFYLQSAQICSTVGDNWLAWASFLFNRIDKEAGGSKEEAFVALLQAVAYCNGAKARRAILKLLLLMDRHESLCDTDMFHKLLQEIDIGRFVYFVPQLVGLLEKEDVELTRIVLVKMSKEYLEAVMGPLKTTRERLRNVLYPRKEDNECEAQMSKLKMEGKGGGRPRVPDGEQMPRVKSVFLENVARIYNQVRNKAFGKECWQIQHYLHNSFNSNVFKESELICLEIEKVFNDAVAHVVHRGMGSGPGHAAVLNELISRVSLSLLSKGLKEEIIASIFGMRCICPLENIDDLVRFKSKIQRVVEESFHKTNRFEESEVNLMLHQSRYEHTIFGQYSEIRGSYKSLVRMEMFEPRWSYMYRRRMGRSRVHLRGSDGKMYRYEMKEMSRTRFSELALPQLSLMINEAMKEDPQLCRRGAELKLFVPCVVSEALAVECVGSLFHEMDSILGEGLSKHGIGIDQCVLLYLNHFASIYDLDEKDGWALEKKYDLGKGLVRSAKTRRTKGECPNARRSSKDVDEDLEENESNNPKAIVGKQREKYTRNLRQNRITCLGCDGKGEGIEACTYRYEISKQQKYAAYERVYNTFKTESYVDRYFGLAYGSLGKYFRFKRRVLSSYSTNSAFLYMLSVVDRRPGNIVVARDTGYFMNRTVCCEEGEGLGRAKGVGGIITPGMQKLFGKEGIEGIMVSIMYHYADMLNSGDWHKDLLRVILEGRFADMAGSRLKGVHREVLSRISGMVGKGDDGGYSIIPMVSEWMDVFKLAQADPRNVSWL